MPFDIMYVAGRETIHKRKHAQMSNDKIRENSKRQEYIEKVGSKVLVKKDHLHILRKTEIRKGGRFIVNELMNKERSQSPMSNHNP